MDVPAPGTSVRAKAVISYRLRPGRRDDLERLGEIERSAGEMFAAHGMSAVAEDEPFSIEELTEYCVRERLWVVTDESDRPVAYSVADLIDGCAHLEQVSVHADHAGQRLGQALIEAVVEWARERQLPAVTLTTFSEVPWNGPYYARLGFETIPEASLSPGLRRIRREEAEHGLDRWPRVCMRKGIDESC